MVFVNMGTRHQSARDRFRRRLAEGGVDELAVAACPPAGQRNAHYTWAVFIDDVDADRWLQEAKAAWLMETDG